MWSQKTKKRGCEEKMKLFIDSADVDEIKKAYALGIMDGVTTNPSLIKKAAEKYATKDMKSYIENIFDIVGNDPVSLEVKGGTSDEMYAQARSLYSKFKTAHNTVVIKIPISSSVVKDDSLTIESLKVIKRLSGEGVPTNVTLVFSPEQALLAAKSGATYVSPFVGREDDYVRKKQGVQYNKNDYFVSNPADDSVETDNGINSGLELVDDILLIFAQFGFTTQVLSASLRNTRQVREAAMLGSHVATIPYSVIEDMIKHEKTLEGMQTFTSDFVPEYKDLLK